MKIAPMRGMFPAFIVMLLLAGSAVGALAVSDGTGSLGGVHWARRGTPFTLEVGDNTRGKWPAYLRRAARQWNRSDVVRFKVVSGNANPTKCQQTNGRVEVCSANYGQSGWLGLTRLFYANNDKQHIIAATTRLNDSYFNQKNGTYNTKNAR
ncbi:MAG: hypothetical protein IT337_01530, partial [Thermomicrobiales bacterium]|nr:hypothetical protein [Thermomicrobiales bacterium]